MSKDVCWLKAMWKYPGLFSPKREFQISSPGMIQTGTKSSLTPLDEFYTTADMENPCDSNYGFSFFTLIEGFHAVVFETAF